MHSKKRGKKNPPEEVDKALKASVLIYEESMVMDFQKKIHKIFSIFSFSFLFFFSAAFQVFRNHQQKYFFTFLQCKWVGEFSLAFHIDLLCVLYHLIACLASVSSIYTTTCRSITPLARSTGGLFGTFLWWAEYKSAPVKWLVTVQKHTFPFKLRKNRKQKPLQRKPEKGTPCPRIWGKSYDD